MRSRFAALCLCVFAGRLWAAAGPVPHIPSSSAERADSPPARVHVLAARPGATPAAPGSTCTSAVPGQPGAANGCGEPCALELFERMSASMESSNYSGTFIYRHGDKVETLRIVHRRTPEGRVSEKLMTLTGEPREIIRDDAVVTCILPESRLVLIDKSRRRETRFPGVIPDNLNRLSDYYAVQVQGEDERVAGRAAHVVDVRPKDEYRYGYRLWIDRGSNLLLRSDLLGDDNQPIEQVMFTELEVHERMSDDLFKPQYLDEGYRWREMGEVSVAGDEHQALWHASRLPPGFSLQTHNRRLKPSADKPVEHMVFSDGMTSVSVFIENERSKRLVRGSLRRGALNVYGRKKDEHHITVMGEVPGVTVRLIAESIEPLRP